MTPFEKMEQAVREAAAAAQAAEKTANEAREMAAAAERAVKEAAEHVLAAMQAEARAKDVLIALQAQVQKADQMVEKALAEQHEIEEARRKVLDGVAAGSRFQFVIANASDLQNNAKPPKIEIQLPQRLRRLLNDAAPAPIPKKPLVPVVLEAPAISVVPEAEPMLIMPVVLPAQKVVNPQGDQPGRKVPHQPKSLMMEMPWPDVCRAIIYHMFGYMYRLPLVGVHQRYMPNPDHRMCVSDKEAGIPVVKVALLAQMVKLPWSCLITVFAAFNRVPWSMRLVTPHKAHGWKLTPFGLRLLDDGTLNDIEHLAREYYRCWETPILMKKDSKARALYYGANHPTNMQEIINLHREFELGPIVHNPPAPLPPRPLLNNEVDGQEPEAGAAGA